MAFPKMKNSKEFIAHVGELMAGVPGVTIKSMFGGHGVFREGLMFGCLARDELYLRVDGERREQVKSQGGEQFGFEMRGRPMTMPYFTVPSDALEDAELMTELAAAAFADALAADAAKPKSKRKHKPGS